MAESSYILSENDSSEMFHKVLNTLLDGTSRHDILHKYVLLLKPNFVIVLLITSI